MWCHKDRDTSYVYHSGGGSISTEYRHRAEYLGNKQKNCTLKIKDIRTADRGTYRFRFETDDPGGKWTGVPGVTLSVSGKIWDCFSFIFRLSVEEMLNRSIQQRDIDQAAGRGIPSCHASSSGSHPGIQGQRAPHFRHQITMRPPPARGHRAPPESEKKLNSRSLFLPDAPKSTSVSVSPSGEIVEGSPVTLTCSSNANPPVQRYSWFQSSGAAVWEKGSGQSLIISNLSSGDSGQYYCEAQNKHGAHNSTAVPLTITGTVRITHRDMSVAFSGNCQISLC
ncbi:sialoadhesin-like [Amia ocellicauda]|uniref:sialoadhesin-like n=1 Tax=Amia ocellicauda TaxID=2972642 RepID=UPI003463ACCA